MVHLQSFYVFYRNCPIENCGGMRNKANVIKQEEVCLDEEHWEEKKKERGAVLYISVQMNSALWPTSAGWMSEHLSLNPTKNNDDSSHQHRQAHKTGG